MIALNSKNGKVATSRHDSFKFQYNPSFKSSEFKTKDALKIAFKQHRDTWNLEEGVDNLFKRVNEGYTVQFGVNTTSTQVDDIEYFDGFFIDYDGWDKKNDCPIEGIATIEEILELPFVKEHCLFYQLSFSNRPEALSVHLFFLFDKRTRNFKHHHLSAKLATKILTEQIGNRGGFDEAVTNNVGQVCFAGRGEAYAINLEATPINLEVFVEEAEELGIKPTAAIANRQAKRDGVEPPKKATKPQAKNLEPKKNQPTPESAKTDNNSEYDDSGDGITNWALRRIQTDIIDGKLESNWSAIYCLYDHNWKTSSRAIDAAAIAQLDGSNPFSSTNGSGGSFTITKYDNDLPPVFYDRSGGFEATDINGNLKSGGNIIEYVFALMRTENGLPKYVTKNSNGKYILDSELFKKNFKEPIKYLYKHFGLKPLDFRKYSKKENGGSNDFDELLKEIVDECYEKFHNKVIFLQDREYFAWVNKRKKWEILTGIDKPFAAVFSPYIEERWGRDICNNPKVRQTVLGAFKNGNESDRIPTQDINYIPLNNGLFDIKTKKLIPNEGQAFNTNTLPWNFNPESIPTDDDPVIKKFKQYWGWWACSDVKGKLLLNWIILVLQFRAWQTEKIMGLIGESGKGKSTYSFLINALMNGATLEQDKWTPNTDGYAVKPQTERLVSDYNHNTSVLEGKMHVFLEELKGGYADKAPSILKNLSGNVANRSLTINRKGEHERTIKFMAGTTFDCEKMIKLPPDEKGYWRRIVFILINQDAGTWKDGELPLDCFYENLEKIAIWCLMQDGKVVLKEFLELSEDPSIKKDVSDIRFENDTMAQFIIDNYEFTDDELDVVALEDIHLLFNRIRQQNGYGKELENRKYFGDRLKSKITDASLGFNWKGKSKQIGKKKATYYTHLKLINDF